MCPPGPPEASVGHASIATTASFYSHVTPSMLRRSADRMDEILGRASGA
jgi:hypothetical protein